MPWRSCPGPDGALDSSSCGQVLIDLIGAGALVGLGLFQLTPAVAMGEEN